MHQGGTHVWVQGGVSAGNSPGWRSCLSTTRFFPGGFILTVSKIAQKGWSRDKGVATVNGFQGKIWIGSCLVELLKSQVRNDVKPRC